MPVPKSIFTVCLDCAAVIKKGPYHQRRILKHLRLTFHDHPAAQFMTPEEHTAWIRQIGRFRRAGIIIGAVDEDYKAEMAEE